MKNKEIFTYTGTEVDVDWDGRICIHMGECGYAKGDLFVGGRDPWCQPDLSSSDDVKDIVERCPAGALVYRFKGIKIKEQAAQENTVVVAYNGPYFVRGELNIVDAPDDMPGVKFRSALCRCGLSKSKPFCDNSHKEGRFEDFGAVGEKGNKLESKGGELKITPMADGPLILSGNVTLKASSGRVAWQGNNLFLCRCGASRTKPFCDGSHSEAGFKS